MTAAQLETIQKTNKAFARAIKGLLKPGVKLKVKKGVPLYSADPDHPEIIIRHLNGKTDYGRLSRSGAFLVRERPADYD